MRFRITPLDPPIYCYPTLTRTTQETSNYGARLSGYVGTKDQLADVLTKALGGPVFQDIRKKVGVTEISV